MANTPTKELTVDELRVRKIIIGPETGKHMTLEPSELWLRDRASKGLCCSALRH